MASYPRFLPRLRGTFFPFLRASDRAIAMACLRLVTLPPLPPLPLRRVPRFRRRIALSTSLLALGLYLRLPDFFFAILCPPGGAGDSGPYLVPLEILDGPLVLPGRRERREGAEIPSFAGLWILLPRVEPVLAGSGLSDHSGTREPRRYAVTRLECRDR